MARHRGQSRHNVPALVAVAVVVVMLAAGGYAVMLVRHDGSADAGRRGAGPSAATTSPAPSTTAPRATSSSPSTATSAGVDPREAAAAQALRRCAAETADLQKVAQAAAGSAHDWGMHTDAQRRLDAGVNTVAQTEAQWAASKARGPADVRAFASATTAARSSAGGCSKVVDATKGTVAQAKGAACATRARALAEVQSAGAKVNAEWAAHLVIMGKKAHTPAAAYLDRWLQMVKASTATLAHYRSAAAALAKAPRCAA